MTQQKKQNFTSNHQTTTTSRATGVIKIVALIIGGVLIITSPFWHEPFRYQKNELNQLKATHSQNIKDSEIAIHQLRQDFTKQPIQDYVSSLHTALDNLEAVKTQNFKELSELKAETKVLDWRNTYIFLIALGTRIPLLIFPLLFIYLFKCGVIKLEHQTIKTAFVAFCSGTMAVGIFWMFWVFWPFKNLPFDSYIYTIISSSLLIGAAITQFMLWKEIKLEKQKRIIRYLNRLLIVVIPSMVKDIHVEEYEELKWEALDYETK